MEDLLARRAHPPARARRWDWAAVARAAGIDHAALLTIETALTPGFDALSLEIGPLLRYRRQARSLRKRRSTLAIRCVGDDSWFHPTTFARALTLQMTRRALTSKALAQTLAQNGLVLDGSTLVHWRSGFSLPRLPTSLAAVRFLEGYWNLPQGYFTELLRPKGDGGVLRPDISASEVQRLSWHLPRDFMHRPLDEQQEIMSWVRRTIAPGNTAYRDYVRQAARHRFAVRFPGFGKVAKSNGRGNWDGASAMIEAPSALASEVAALVNFKTATVPPEGYRRSGVWNPASVDIRVQHLGLILGALVAAPDSPARGFGAPVEAVSLALLLFPQVHDWHLRWREQRRGFLTDSEGDMLRQAAAMCAADVGWITQTPSLADRLVPIPGLVEAADIARLKANWEEGCAGLRQYAVQRQQELRQVTRVHRDPFEPIMVVLNAASPVGEYRKIADEILRQLPSLQHHSRSYAQAVRAFLMIRLGLHLGFRQRNLRELLFCPRGGEPRTERQLADLRRGEIRFNASTGMWEVLCPAVAFKNADSGFFKGRAVQIPLPEVGELHTHIEAWIARHRTVVLGGGLDPGTFFVKTGRRGGSGLAYTATGFFHAWSDVIRRYGIYNPYTGRGAIVGLLPHGPHAVRDVLATHVLKKTGSFEVAGYAIQDTAKSVASHYVRFLPDEKIALAAKIINQEWEEG